MIVEIIKLRFCSLFRSWRLKPLMIRLFVQLYVQWRMDSSTKDH